MGLRDDAGARFYHDNAKAAAAPILSESIPPTMDAHEPDPTPVTWPTEPIGTPEPAPVTEPDPDVAPIADAPQQPETDTVAA